MLIFLLIAILAAVFRGYRSTAALPSLIPLFLAEAAYLVCQSLAFFGDYTLVKYAGILQALFILTLIVPVIRWRLYKCAFAGLAMVAGGSLMNRFVISANDGHMPVYPTLSRLTGYYRDGVLGETADIDGLHILMTSSTKLNWLADYIDLGFSVLSPGDLLIHAFLVIVVFYSFKASCAKKLTA